MDVMRNGLRHAAHIGVIVAWVLVATMVVQRIAAQESTTPGLEIEFSGVVEGVAGNSLSIGGRLVDTSEVQLLVAIQPGMRVNVRAELLPDGRILARDVLIVAGQAATLEPAVMSSPPASTPEAEPDDCILSQNYWRTHPDAWQVNTLMLGTQSYTWQDLLQIFNTPVREDISLILAHQLIAAKLNIASGANADTIGATILQADVLLGGFPGRLPYNVPAASQTAVDMIGVATALNDFNNAQIGPNCAAVRPAATPDVLPGVQTVPAVTPEVVPAALPLPVPATTPEVFSGGASVPQPATTPEVSSGGGRDVQPPASTPELSPEEMEELAEEAEEAAEEAADEASDRADEREDAASDRADEREDAASDRNDDDD